MAGVREVHIRAKPVTAFGGILGTHVVEMSHRTAVGLQRKLGERVIWNLNSTASGGGVAEMLQSLLPYARGLGVDARWLVIEGNEAFFRITKRIHNALHGEPGDGSALDEGARAAFDKVTAANEVGLAEIVRPDDIAILHDPQTAGLIPDLVRRGVSVVWRCHIGSDASSVEADAAWRFLEPYLKHAHAFVFSRFQYLPDVLYHGRCLIVAPSIDPFSPKNQDMDDATVRSTLTYMGLLSGDSNGARRLFELPDGTLSQIERRAEVVRVGPPPSPDVPLVVQVSRWDRLKDPLGVLEGFLRATRLPATENAELMLVGPSMARVTDDPEGVAVYDEVLAAWKALAPERRRRVHLVTLPMEDLHENAAMVNALQRHATVVVQKSLREGFGLTVTEAMWKSRPVIASAVGGIQDQIQHGVSGLLLRDPADLDAFAGAVTQLLGNEGLARRLGANAHDRVCKNFLGLNLLTEYEDLVDRLDHETRPAPAPKG